MRFAKPLLVYTDIRDHEHTDACISIYLVQLHSLSARGQVNQISLSHLHKLLLIISARMKKLHCNSRVPHTGTLGVSSRFIADLSVMLS